MGSFRGSRATEKSVNPRKKISPPVRNEGFLAALEMTKFRPEPADKSFATPGGGC